ncbi:MAG TPA: hypothetical protein VJT31_09185 [Rugosimonospora sp.]|nr:hypothetical protein [Rugosimonospora sp.]
MFLILPSTLLVAALIASPALWHALVVGDVSLSSAMARFLIAVPVSGLMMSILRGLTASYRKNSRPPPDGGEAGAERAPEVSDVDGG